MVDATRRTPPFGPHVQGRGWSGVPPSLGIARVPIRVCGRVREAYIVARSRPPPFGGEQGGALQRGGAGSSGLPRGPGWVAADRSTSDRVRQGERQHPRGPGWVAAGVHRGERSRCVRGDRGGTRARTSHSSERTPRVVRQGERRHPRGPIDEGCRGTIDGRSRSPGRTEVPARAGAGRRGPGPGPASACEEVRAGAAHAGLDAEQATGRRIPRATGGIVVAAGRGDVQLVEIRAAERAARDVGRRQLDGR